MPERMKGKVALITGGGGGIGEATARLFFEEDALAVAIVDFDGDAARRAADGIDPTGERVLAITADLGQQTEAERAVRETVTRFGRLDSLANVAGVRLYGPLTDATPESWEYIIRANLLSYAFCARFSIPEMEKNGGGTIVNISSVMGERGRSGMVQYDATKGAIGALTRAMACDHAPQNIRVNCICPGATLTMFHIRRRAEADGISLAEAEERLRRASGSNSRILLRRQGEPREIANAILFLACDESSYVTGATLFVDGGLGV